MSTVVVAVSGPPGSGKSTLVARLARETGARIVAFDDHERITSRSPAEIAAWLDEGAPLDAVEAPGLREALLAARAMGGLTLFETQFGRALPMTADLIDHAVWLDCPKDLALARKLAAILKDAHATGGPESRVLPWIEGYLQAYAFMVRRSLEMQESRVKPLCESVVSTAEGPLESYRALREALSEIC